MMSITSECVKKFTISARCLLLRRENEGKNLEISTECCLYRARERRAEPNMDNGIYLTLLLYFLCV